MYVAGVAGVAGKALGAAEGRERRAEGRGQRVWNLSTPSLNLESPSLGFLAIPAESLLECLHPLIS